MTPTTTIYRINAKGTGIEAFEGVVREGSAWQSDEDIGLFFAGDVDKREGYEPPCCFLSREEAVKELTSRLSCSVLYHSRKAAEAAKHLKDLTK